jgi:PKD repeat protein
MAIIIVAFSTAAVLLSGGVAAQEDPGNETDFVVAQGTTCEVVTPVEDQTQNVSSFYDYRNPYPSITGNPYSGTYSSFGTTEYQTSRESSLFFYSGSDGTSLVLVHGELGDETGGSTATFDFQRLPANGGWVIRDDEYPFPDDDWTVEETSTVVDWKWGPNRTDGGAYRGVSNLDGPIVINPGFNEEAAHWGDWGYSGSPEYRMLGWTIRDADGTAYELDRDRRIFIHNGPCVSTPPSASVSGPNTTTPGETVTLDASDTTDDEEIGGYEWDFDGDGTVDEITTSPVVEHAFSSGGNQTASVTAFDTYGNGDTATLDISVTQIDESPSATLDAPGTAIVNESVTLDASGSTPADQIAEYRWDFDGDGTIDANTTSPTTDHAYGASGTYEPTVTVVNGSGGTASASTSVTVESANAPVDEPPSAALDTLGTVIVNESVTLDASGSTDDEAIVEYRWDFNGDGTDEETTANATATHTYTELGEYQPTVTVVDASNQTAAASAVVDVTEQPIEPEIQSTPANPEPGEQISFDAVTALSEGSVADYNWTFGDGSTANGSQTTHTYDSAGTYQVTLTVQTTDGRSATSETNVTVASNDGGGGNGGAGGGGDGGSGGDGGNGGAGGGSSGGGSSGGGSSGGGSSGGGSSGGSSGGAPGGGGGGGGGGSSGEPSIASPDVSFDATELVAGETLIVQVTVENTGDGTGTKSVEFEIDDELIEDREITLAPGETRTLTFTHQFTTPGTKSVQIDAGEKRDVEVTPASSAFTVRDASVSHDPIQTGEEFTIEAVVENPGEMNGTKRVNLTLFGEVVDSQDVTLSPGQRGTVSFNRQITAPGNYTAQVGNESVSLTVVGEPSSDPAASDPSQTASTGGGGVSLAGFAAILTAVATLAAGFFLVRRE